MNGNRMSGRKKKRREMKESKWMRGVLKKREEKFILMVKNTN